MLSRGGHGFSRDGVSWNYTNAAYNCSVVLESGGLYTYARRERPHLLLDDAGNPAFLSNGVLPNHHSGHQENKDWSFTGVFEVNSNKA